MLVVPGLLVADDDLLTWLRDYAAAGGHLVIGPRTAYGDEEGRARVEVKPAHLADAGGVRYQEFSNLNEPLTVVAETRRDHPVRGGRGHRLGRRPDQRRREGDRRLRPPALRPVPGRGVERARSRSDHHSRHRCRILPSPPISSRWLASGHEPKWERPPASVTVHSATNTAGERIHVVHNWSWTPTDVTLPRAMTDILAAADGTTNDLELGPWDVRVLAE